MILVTENKNKNKISQEHFYQELDNFYEESLCLDNPIWPYFDHNGKPVMPSKYLDYAPYWQPTKLEKEPDEFYGAFDRRKFW